MSDREVLRREMLQDEDAEATLAPRTFSELHSNRYKVIVLTAASSR